MDQEEETHHHSMLHSESSVPLTRGRDYSDSQFNRAKSFHSIECPRPDLEEETHHHSMLHSESVDEKVNGFYSHKSAEA